MNDPAHLIELPVEFRFGPLHTALTQVDCIRQEGAAVLNRMSVAAFFHLDSPVFEELVYMREEFVFFDFFHTFIHL